MTKEEKRIYLNIHQNIRRWHGKANKCENPDCESVKPKRYEWALKKGRTYSENINDYIQLCPSCHRKYDETEERRAKLSKIHKGKHYHGRDRTVIQIDCTGKMVAEFISIAEANRMTGILNTGICNVLSELSHTAGGYSWKYKTHKRK